MNGGSSSNQNNGEVREVAMLICREFRSRFKQDPDVRVEQCLETLESWVSQFDRETAPSARTALTLELICCEMELLLESAQPIDLSQYDRRFPAFSEAIHQAAKRIRLRGGKDLVIGDSDITRISDPVSPVQRESDDETTGLVDENLELDVRDIVQHQRDESVPTQFGVYRQIERISSGGFGTVCRAIDSRDNRVVALKFPRRDKFHRTGLKTFIDEANKSMILDHPGIVRTYAIEAHDQYLAIVQQFIDGADLKSPLVQPRAQTEIVEMIANIADALAYAHREGIYHRDLKPGNILVDRQGRPYLADFGLALHELDQLNSPPQRCGTTYYMPPEQVAGLTQRLDGRSDIWSLGVVFYELLTHRKPFDGVTEDDIYDQIENKDPRPPRQIDLSIDREVQRICLKCLERHQRDRYPTADELAEDLRHWLGSRQGTGSESTANSGVHSTRGDAGHSSTSGPTRSANRTGPLSDRDHGFKPKGIRPYTVEDAEFFLELLPGTRNRDGIPDSIRFWLTRICEPVKQVNRVPVGILVGPSGSGKTSFVKAGLLPLLPRGIETVYLEASQTKTEHQLLLELRNRWSGLPDDLALTDVLRGLSRGKWLPTGTNKLLIVIDQFEQYLARDRDLTTTPLVKALRHCDGKNVQCLLLVRDDFTGALSRFLDALEVDFREGENAQSIDLFDWKHAQRVLTRLGRYHEQLPPEPVELSKEQSRFVEEAVGQLMKADHVICVHLTLFAEMFRHRPWTIGELRNVGGVAGTGEKYLELTFGPDARDKRLFLQREAVQAMLECLLPNSSSNIRGTIQSEQALIKAARLEPKPFADLIKVLEGQLRLLTRTDPEVVRSVLPEANESEPAGTYYQLTHDYLVPSIRSWLETGWDTTRSGRAKKQLRNLARLVEPGQPPPKLPSSLEWLSWQYRLPRKFLTESERVVLRAAGRRFARQLAIATVLMAVCGFLIWQGVRSRREQRQRLVINDLIAQLVQKEDSKIPEIVKLLEPLQAAAAPLLSARLQESEPNSREQIRMAMALLPSDTTQLPVLIQSLTSARSSPEQIHATIELLREYDLVDRVDIKSSYEETFRDPDLRFHALASEIALRQGAGDWAKYDGLVISALQLQPLSSIDDWLKLLQPAGSQFTRKFQAVLAETTDPNEARILAKALHGFLSEGERQNYFPAAIERANGARFSGLMRALQESATAEWLTPRLQAAFAQAEMGPARANLGVALFRLGIDQPLLDLFQGGIEDQGSLLAVFGCKPERVSTFQLLSLYERCRLSEFGAPGAPGASALRRCVLQSLAHHATGLLDEDFRNQLAAIARHHVENDPDACCFSTSELILTRLGMGSRRQWRDIRRKKSVDGILGNVLIDMRGNAFSILQDDIGRLAYATTELTQQALREYCQESGVDPKKLQASDFPFEISGLESIKLVLDYCNWLSGENQLDETEFCFPAEFEVDQVPQLSPRIAGAGYRLTSAEEFRMLLEKNAPLLNLEMDDREVLFDYAWAFQNSGADVQPVGTALPNALGVFDTFGNVSELSQSQHNLTTEWDALGQTVRAETHAFSLTRADRQPVAANIWTRMGFRLVRRLK